MLYLLLVAAVGRVLVRMWASPVQAVALVLTMHGIRQVGVAVLPDLAESPFLMNVAVGGIVAIALAISAIRGGVGMPGGAYAASWTGFLVFYGFYAWCVVATEAFRDPSVSSLLLRVAPYVVLQLLVTTSLVGSSSPTELREALVSTWFICLSIIGIALTDSSLRVDELDASFRLLLRTQQSETLASNPLALADVGVMLMVLTLQVMPGAVKAALPSLSRIEGLASAAGAARLALVGGVAVAVLWISRAEPAMAVVAMIITGFAARSRGRVGIAVLALVAVPLAAASGLAGWAFDTLIAWFPRLETIDEGIAIRLSIIERLIDRYSGGGFGVLLFGLGPGYSLMHFGLYPHNHLVECLTELGLVGLLVAAAGPVIAWRRGARLLRTSPAGAALGNTLFFHTMLTYSILVSMKRGSVVHPDTFMWAAVIGFLHARACGLPTAPEPSVAGRPLRPSPSAIPVESDSFAGVRRSFPMGQRHATA